MSERQTERQTDDFGGIVDRLMDKITHPQHLYSFAAAAAIPILKGGRKFAARNPTIAVIAVGAFILGYYLTRSEKGLGDDEMLH